MADGDHLPPPDMIAEKIVEALEALEALEAALEQFRLIAADLN